MDGVKCRFHRLVVLADNYGMLNLYDQWLPVLPSVDTSLELSQTRVERSPPLRVVGIKCCGGDPEVDIFLEPLDMTDVTVDELRPLFRRDAEKAFPEWDSLYLGIDARKAWWVHYAKQPIPECVWQIDEDVPLGWANHPEPGPWFQ